MLFCSDRPGIGTGLCYTPAVTAVSHYFEKYRSVANGISLAAPGLGFMTAPHFLRVMIESHGWRYSAVMLGCATAQVRSLSLSLSLSAFPFNLWGEYLRLWSFFYSIFLSSPRMQQPQSVSWGSTFLLSLNEFPSLMCWCIVTHHHRLHGPTLLF